MTADILACTLLPGSCTMGYEAAPLDALLRRPGDTIPAGGGPSLSPSGRKNPRKNAHRTARRRGRTDHRRRGAIAILTLPLAMQEVASTPATAKNVHRCAGTRNSHKVFCIWKKNLKTPEQRTSAPTTVVRGGRPHLVRWCASPPLFQFFFHIKKTVCIPRVPAHLCLIFNNRRRLRYPKTRHDLGRFPSGIGPSRSGRTRIRAGSTPAQTCAG